MFTFLFLLFQISTAKDSVNVVSVVETPNEPELSCQICANNPHKYKCPRCDLKTCSLSCCLEHKEKFNCSGVRDAVVYCHREDYGYHQFLQDYHLLEEIDRRNAVREKQLFQLARKNRPRVRNRILLCKVADTCGVTLRLSPNSVLSRALLNRSHVVEDENGTKSIRWSIEFRLIPLHYDTNTLQRNTNLNRLRCPRLVIHDCDDKARLMSLWNERVVQLNSDEQDALLTYKPAGSAPFGVVTSWLHSRVKRTDGARYYFYVQAERAEIAKPGDSAKCGIARRVVPVEIFSSNRLLHILIESGAVVHEMPTIWVSHSPIPSFA